MTTIITAQNVGGASPNEPQAQRPDIYLNSFQPARPARAILPCDTQYPASILRRIRGGAERKV